MFVEMVTAAMLSLVLLACGQSADGSSVEIAADANLKF